MGSQIFPIKCQSLSGFKIISHFDFFFGKVSSNQLLDSDSAAEEMWQTKTLTSRPFLKENLKTIEGRPGPWTKTHRGDVDVVRRRRNDRSCRQTGAASRKEASLLHQTARLPARQEESPGSTSWTPCHVAKSTIFPEFHPTFY